MQSLKDRIRQDGKILPGGIVKVDSFLNHQIDPVLMHLIGQEFHHRFQDMPITRILTIETSGIAAALTTGFAFGVPVVFAKKHKSANMSGQVYASRVYSYTKKTEYEVSVATEYLSRSDRVLIVDDFLATGNALKGLTDILSQSGARLCGIGIVIEKSFQHGGRELREAGYRVESLARIRGITEDGVLFDEDPPA